MCFSHQDCYVHQFSDDYVDVKYRLYRSDKNSAIALAPCISPSPPIYLPLFLCISLSSYISPSLPMYLPLFLYISLCSHISPSLPIYLNLFLYILSFNIHKRVVISLQNILVDYRLATSALICMHHVCLVYVGSLTVLWV